MKNASYLLKVFILFVLYYITARFGLSFDAVSGFATLVWLPTGIALSFVFLFGYEMAPGIALGAYFANIATGAPMTAAIGISLGNTLEALIGAFFLKRVGFRVSLERVRDVLDLIFVAVGATAISATIGVLSLYAVGIVTSDTFPKTWSAWWIGDTLSALIVASVIFVWSVKTHIDRFLQQWYEELILFSALIFVTLFVFRGLFGFFVKESPVTYLTEPILIWIALRLRQRECVTAVFLVTAIAIWATVESLGPFSTGNINHDLLYLQGYIGTTAMTLMLFSAAISERKEMSMRKDHFISMAAHELKNPITSLSLYSQLLRKQSKNEFNPKKNLQYLNQIGRQTERMTLLVSDLLDLSRIAFGKLEIRGDWFDLNKLVKETISSVKIANKKHMIRVEGQIKEKVYGDTNRISQVILNLVINAIKYSPGQEKIVIQLKNINKNALVSITDSGIGVPKGAQEKIFDRFYQANSSTEESVSGLGIGLYISKQIIEKHNGRIWAESKVGRGSTFFFTLPLGKPRTQK